MNKVILNNKVANTIPLSELPAGHFGEVIAGSMVGDIVYMNMYNFANVVGDVEGDGWSNASSQTSVKVRPLVKGEQITITIE